MEASSSASIDNNPSVTSSVMVRKTEAKKRTDWKEILLVSAMLIGALLLGSIIGGSALGGGAQMQNNGLNLNPFLFIAICAGLLILAAVGGNIVQLVYWKWRAPEAFLFHKIRTRKMIFARVTGLGGREQWYPARVSTDGGMLEVNLKGEWKSIGINPHVLGQGKNSFYRGIEIVDVMENNMAPLGPGEAASLYTLEEHYKNPQHNYKVLPFMDDATVLFLYTAPPGELEEHCLISISVDTSTITPVDLKLDPRKDGETDDEYRGRVQEAFNHAYALRCNEELAKLKGEILRLKEETRNFIVPSRVFVRHEAGAAMDVRYYLDFYERQKKVIANKMGVKNTTQIPEWVKLFLLIAIGTVGTGLMGYLILQGVKAVMG